jgi:hypothetical protein
MERADLGNALDNVENGVSRSNDRVYSTHLRIALAFAQVYAGWAMVGDSGPYKTVASIGLNPTYGDISE